MNKNLKTTSHLLPRHQKLVGSELQQANQCNEKKKICRPFVDDAFFGEADDEREEAVLEVLLERDVDVEPDDELSSDEPVVLPDEELDEDSCLLRPLSLSLLSFSGLLSTIYRTIQCYFYITKFQYALNKKRKKKIK